jgi:hypothetical protein
VSSHNDAVPNNILFDGRRLWLIDWESAYCNDPLVDVAIMLDGVARGPEMEEVLLGAWLGRTPDELTRGRLDVVRALTRLYYAGVFLSASAAASWVKQETDLSAPSSVDFQRAIKAGRLKAAQPKPKHILGKMFLASFLFRVLWPRRDLTPRSSKANPGHLLCSLSLSLSLKLVANKLMVQPWISMEL